MPFNSHTVDLFDYCTKLHEHDWTFEYSEDQNVWQQGRQELGALRLLQPKLDPDFAVWNKFAPEGYKQNVK